MRGEISGRLRLGVIPTIAPYLLHKFIPDFVQRYPHVEIEIREMVTADIIDALNHDRIDAAIVASGTCPEGIIEHDMFSDRFFLYVSPSNPLYERSNVRIEDIDMNDLILLSPGNCMRDQILELCQARRETVQNYSFESGTIDTLMRLVDCTGNVTIIPEMALEYIPAEHRSQVKTLAKGATSRKIAVAVRRTYVKTSIVQALMQTIMSSVTKRVK
jgi:LysR family hydrogen peroxide-inducible transcriptional activator